MRIKKPRPPKTIVGKVPSLSKAAKIRAKSYAANRAGDLATVRKLSVPTGTRRPRKPSA